MSWKQSNVQSPVDDELVKFLENSAVLSDKVSGILDTASEILDVVSALYVEEADPLASVMGIIVSQIQNFFNDLFGTGVHTLVINPFGKEKDSKDKPGVKKKIVDEVLGESTLFDLKTDEFGIPLLTPSDAIDLAVDSFYDLNDPDRPIFSEGATIGAYGILLTAPGLEIFIESLEALNEIFSIPEFEYTLKKVKLLKNPPAASENPDWQKLALNSFEPLGEIQREMNDYLQIALGYLSPKNSALEDLIYLIIDKVTELNDKIRVLTNLLLRLRNAADATGLWVFKFGPTTGGTLSLEDALLDQDFYLLSDYKYTALALFVGGGPSLKPIQILSSLLG